MAYILPFLEVHAVDHCNHTCRWCHNYSPSSPAREFAAEEYFAGLDVLVANRVHWEVISLMGGEPFLHRDLPRFAWSLITRYKRPAVVTTNGFWLSSENIRLYKDLWPMLALFKLSRYPSIEKRLGGEARIRSLLDELQSYNPSMRVEWPNKYHFNELAFTQEPVEPELYCGNSQCLALLTDMRMGHCGAGAYQHLAPEGTLSKGFLESKHMFYDLRAFTMQSFQLWHKRYPLDACAYCNLSQKLRSVAWRPVKGQGLFLKEHEYAFERNQCLRMEALGEKEGVNERVRSVLAKAPEAASHLSTVAAARCATGDALGSLALIQDIIKAAPENPVALQTLAAITRRVRESALSASAPAV